uniref:Uncharacterized protein n=1 Tax=Neogobius melanostomus TaxID=47308 RepID=A0A8C6WU33_9GOBI
PGAGVRRAETPAVTTSAPEFILTAARLPSSRPQRDSSPHNGTVTNRGKRVQPELWTTAVQRPGTHLQMFGSLFIEYVRNPSLNRALLLGFALTEAMGLSVFSSLFLFFLRQ